MVAVEAVIYIAAIRIMVRALAERSSMIIRITGTNKSAICIKVCVQVLVKAFFFRTRFPTTLVPKQSGKLVRIVYLSKKLRIVCSSKNNNLAISAAGTPSSKRRIALARLNVHSDEEGSAHDALRHGESGKE